MTKKRLTSEISNRKKEVTCHIYTVQISLYVQYSSLHFIKSTPTHSMHKTNHGAVSNYTGGEYTKSFPYSSKKGSIHAGHGSYLFFVFLVVWDKILHYSILFKTLGGKNHEWICEEIFYWLLVSIEITNFVRAFWDKKNSMLFLTQYRLDRLISS